MKCNNCKNTLTCGCKKRKAADGTPVCAYCVTEYNNKIVAAKTKK